MENILEECGCYPAWMLIHAGNAIKNYYADTRHAEAESCRGYEITCYKRILGRMSNYTTITSPEGEKLTCLPPCNDQLMAVGVKLDTISTESYKFHEHAFSQIRHGPAVVFKVKS